MPVLAVIAEGAACLGLGALVLRALGISGDLNRGEHWAVAFAIGFGTLGWLVFPLGVGGLLGTGPLWVLLVAASLGLVPLCRAGLPVLDDDVDMIGKGLLVLIAFVLVIDFAEAVTPPADADSLAYHFNWPKRFVSAGHISFITQAWDGAIPLLTQLTYVPALALGGEKAMTLWTMASGWASAVFLFVLCRRHLGLNWSLAVALIFLTTPAVIYGAGSGQVEIRMALFVMAGAWAVARSLDTGRLSFAALAGLCAGFYAGSKYLGLLFVAAAGLVILFQRDGIRRGLASGLVFGSAAAIAGFQWYAWNALHTGDPVFPALFQWLGRDDLEFWTADYDRWFKEFLAGAERAVPRNLWWFFAYPFKATFDPLPVFQAKRVGFGPYGVLLLPLSALGAWVFRERIRQSRLLPYGVICALFYAIWFYSGVSQRIRHLLPILPLFLVVMTVAAEKIAQHRGLRGPLVAAVAVCIAIQLAAQGIFSISYLNHLSGGDRESFLERNVQNYASVPWINTNLGPRDRILVGERQFLYYLSVPYFFAAPGVQALVDVRQGAKDPGTLYRQLKSIAITHVLLRRDVGAEGIRYTSPLDALRESGCLELVKSFQTSQFASRILPSLKSRPGVQDILKLRGQECLE
jgi:hypothetical protein